LVAGGIGPANDLLEPFEVLKQAGVEFEFEVARSTSRSEIRLADLPVGADVEFEHGVGLSWVGVGVRKQRGRGLTGLRLPAMLHALAV